MRYKILLLLGCVFFFGSCKSTWSTKKTTSKNKINSHPELAKEVMACYYHSKFNGKPTASGESFSNQKLTAAHKTLPFGTRLRVTNPINKKHVIVKVNDRGPFTKGLDLDLSKKAFMHITDDKGKGRLQVLVEVLP